MGLFDRKKRDVSSASSSGVRLLDRVRQLALAGDDEGVKELLLQMQADGVAGLATDAFDLGFGLLSDDENPLAAQCVLTVVPMLDSASDDEVLKANLFAGMAFDDLEMTEMSVACYRYAADRGLASAQYLLGLSIDGAESVHYLNMAASQGYERAVEFIRDHPDIIAASGGSQSARSGTGTTGGGVLGSSGGLPGSQEPRLTRASDKDPGLRGGLGRNVGAGAAATEPVGGRDEYMKDEPNAGPGATRSFRSPALELPDA